MNPLSKDPKEAALAIVFWLMAGILGVVAIVYFFVP